MAVEVVIVPHVSVEPIIPHITIEPPHISTPTPHVTEEPISPHINVTPKAGNSGVYIPFMAHPNTAGTVAAQNQQNQQSNDVSLGFRGVIFIVILVLVLILALIGVSK